MAVNSDETASGRFPDACLLPPDVVGPLGSTERLHLGPWRLSPRSQGIEDFSRAVAASRSRCSRSARVSPFAHDVEAANY